MNSHETIMKSKYQELEDKLNNLLKDKLEHDNHYRSIFAARMAELL
jgi:hypothetical protein